MPAPPACVRLSPLGNTDQVNQARIGIVQIANMAIFSPQVPQISRFRAIIAMPLGYSGS